MKFWSLEIIKERELIKQVQLEANAECQLFEDEEAMVRLDFTATPVPSTYIIHQKNERIPLTAGLYNLVRMILNECKP